MAHSDEEIYFILKELIAAKTSGAPSAITLDTLVLEELGLNSLTMTDLIIEVEEKFGFEFTEEDLFRLRSMREVVAIIGQRTAAR